MFFLMVLHETHMLTKLCALSGVKKFSSFYNQILVSMLAMSIIESVLLLGPIHSGRKM